MDNGIRNYSTRKVKYKIVDKNTKDGSGSGRRSGKDRRKTSAREYFFEGGVERRSWKERRNCWYMTM